jgi:hypothetical protein
LPAHIGVRASALRTRYRVRALLPATRARRLATSAQNITSQTLDAFAKGGIKTRSSGASRSDRAAASRRRQQALPWRLTAARYWLRRNDAVWRQPYQAILALAKAYM